MGWNETTIMCLPPVNKTTRSLCTQLLYLGVECSECYACEVLSVMTPSKRSLINVLKQLSTVLQSVVMRQAVSDDFNFCCVLRFFFFVSVPCLRCMRTGDLCFFYLLIFWPPTATPFSLDLLHFLIKKNLPFVCVLNCVTMNWKLTKQ